jgi:hypothetical protein
VVVEVLEVVIVLLIINLLVKGDRVEEVILVEYTLTEVEVEVIGIVMVLAAEMVVVKDMLVVIILVMVHQEWDLVEVGLMEQAEEEVVEKEEQVKDHLMEVEQEVEQIIFQVMDSLIIIGKQEEEQVDPIGTFKYLQDLIQTVVMVSLVGMVEVVVVGIVVVLMEMIETV